MEIRYMVNIVPLHGLIALPNVKYNFKKDYFHTASGAAGQVGTSVLLLILKEEKDRSEIKPDDFYPVGLTGIIEPSDDDDVISIYSIKRITIDKISSENGQIYAAYTDRPEYRDMTDEEEAERFEHLKEIILSAFSEDNWTSFARRFVAQFRSASDLAVSLSQYVGLSNEEKYRILEADTISRRMDLIEGAVTQSVELLKVSSEASREQSASNEKLYRENAIRKQIEILQQQLDALHPENVSDVRRFEQLIADSGMTGDALKEAENILARMKREGPDAHEYGIHYDYLEFMTGLSWKKESPPDIDLKKAEKVLSEDHYGLDKVRRRIIEQIAVMKLSGKQSGSILLFVGAPGTGKTSIGQSIARALGREYVRISLGGIRDEASIRGHRRTYVGAMPGRIMDGVRRSGVSNPVIVLDEVDKLVHDYNGDPSSALLEVLDPEQNFSFTDHYMNVPYDLSDVLFICTANTTDTIPEPLLNRMEIIQFQGYTAPEKYKIAEQHLLPRAIEAAGLKKSQVKISPSAVKKIVSDYTMEAGVRGLKKQLDSLCRSAAVKLVEGDKEPITVSVKNLSEFLPQKPLLHGKISKRDEGRPGIVTGLAWTQAGGEILFIETLFTPGSGKLIITGQLGDVMKESVQIAVSLVKNRFPDKAELFEGNDLHIHVPEGATPKDGPSAGITITTALVSLVSGKAVDAKTAMTGEVSLKGNVMPIGGLPEKLMAAVRAGVTRVLIPKENVRDLEDVPSEIRSSLNIIPVETVSDVLKLTRLA